jgi:alkanesulfonate monooxygenase SsuD/methylene tetrahydromethanopterin reductase-like flavin-dependent oxidoreductase (luciferase family)
VLDVFLTSRWGPAAAAAHAATAEAAGFDGVWLAEHHFTAYGQCPSATVLAAHILGASSRITVGTAACVLSARHPVALGEEAAILRSLHGDRFKLGVARGGPWIEVEILGGGIRHYQNGFPESLDLLLRWLSGEPEVDGLEVRPPVTPFPVHVAAVSEATVDIAARLGLPLLLGVHADEAEVKRLVDRWDQLSPAPGTGEHCWLRLAYPGKSSEIRADLAAWQETLRSAQRVVPGPPRDLAAHVEAVLRAHPIGSMSAVAEGIASGSQLVRRQLCLVEATSSAQATAELIESLGSLAP